MNVRALRDFIVETVWELLSAPLDRLSVSFAEQAGVTGAELLALTARVAALEGAAAAGTELATCPMAATVGQLVYETSTAKTVDLADASDPARMPALWFIASKPTATTCVLQNKGKLGGFVDLIPGAVYYADPSTRGGMVTPAPAHVPGQVGQQVCTALSTMEIDITISQEPPVYF